MDPFSYVCVLTSIVAGLAVTLVAVAIYAGYTIVQLRALERLQAESIDRNRTDSLLLLRIQNDLNSVNLAIRDMLDAGEPYPLTAWQAQFKRLRVDLEDAVAREAALPNLNRSGQRQFLSASMAQFWDALDRIFVLAQTDEAEARLDLRRVRLSLLHLSADFGVRDTNELGTLADQRAAFDRSGNDAASDLGGDVGLVLGGQRAGGSDESRDWLLDDGRDRGIDRAGVVRGGGPGFAVAARAAAGRCCGQQHRERGDGDTH